MHPCTPNGCHGIYSGYGVVGACKWGRVVGITGVEKE